MKLTKVGLVCGVAAVALVMTSMAYGFCSPADFNPAWESANPGTCRDKTIPTGALLGNGSLGVVNGGDGNHKEFVLTRGDLWSCGDFTAGGADNNVRPISFANLGIGPGMRTVSSSDTLDLPTATLRTCGKFGKGKVKLESYVAADEDVFIVTGVSDADDSWILRLLTHNERKSFPRESGASKDGFWVRRSTINLLPKDDPRGWVTNATAAVSVLGAELTEISAPDCGEARGTAKIQAGKPFAFIVATDSERRFAWEELERIRASHLAWWKDWWARSRVATGDVELDRFYTGQVYLMGAGIRSGKFPPGLYGIWVTTDNPKWHNDFHMNYNYVGTYYGCFAANRCETADTMPDPLIAYLPQAIRNAKELLPGVDRCRGRFFKNSREFLDRRPDLANGIDDAALYPVSLGPWGSAAESDAFLGQISDGVFQCAVMCTHWEYTLDRAYLEKVWPVLDKTANFFLKWAEKEALANGGYRYNIYDSHWEGSGLEKNSAPALGCVKHLFETLADVAPVLREMGIDVPDEKLAAWKDMRDHLSPLPVGVYQVDGKPVKMLSGVENADGSANPSGRGAINLESVIPGETFSFDVTDEFRSLATNAVNGNIAKSPKGIWTCSNQTPKLFATAIRVGFPPQTIIDAFKKHQLGIMQKNFHIHDGVHGVEKIGAMEFVQSMLLQCDHGFVKVFPNWTGADAKFENLRAKGCFLVSAEMRDGRVVSVEVTSEKGGRFRMVDSFGGKCVPVGWMRGRTRNSAEAMLERDFKPGEKAILRPDMFAACAAAGCCAVGRPGYDTLIAHKGGSDAPANTLFAFKDSVENGFGFECDVRLSKDNRLFTFHDKTISKVIDGVNTNIYDLTWDEIAKINVAGKKWKGTRFDPVCPAFFEEVLALARDGRLIFVEVKPESGVKIVPHLKNAFARQTRATPGNTVFISFSGSICKELKREMPEYKVFFIPKTYTGGGYERYKDPQNLINDMKDMGVDGVDAPFHRKSVIDLQTADYIKTVKDAGFEFHVWTCNTLDQAKTAFERGAQSVATDFPKKLLDEYERNDRR